MRNLLHNGLQLLLSLLFPLGIFAALALSHKIHGLPRYDFVLLCCIVLQIILLMTKMETVREFKVILVFHVLGLILETYKTHMGSWRYPEFAYTKIGTIPLYSGFMYASVASFIGQIWKRFDLSLERWPSATQLLPLALLVYINFFTLHYILDFRWGLLAGIVGMFYSSKLGFAFSGRSYKVPVLLGFFSMGLLIWLAENLSTFLGAWQYPDQATHWKPVDPYKVTSWTLLFIVSFLVVVQEKHRSRQVLPET